MNQCQKIIAHIERYGYITSMDASRRCGIVSLQTRLATLRGEGWVFSNVRVDKGKKHWHEYRIIKRPKKR